MSFFHVRKKCRHLVAFSLVEVVVSIGVFAVVLMSIMGLFPTGLNILRSSMNATVQAQVLQYVVATSSVSSYTNIAQPTATYFDQSGGYLTNSGDSNIRYRVLTQPIATSLPGTSSFSTNDAFCLRITILQQAGPNGPAMASNIYNIQVANPGK